MKTQHAYSRRNFLKTTLAASVAPLILIPGVRAAENTAGEKITLGFIGMGTQNRGLLQGFMRRNETRVLAVCDVDTTRRESAKKTVETYYGDQIKRSEERRVGKECRNRRRR